MRLRFDCQARAADEKATAHLTLNDKDVEMHEISDFLQKRVVRDGQSRRLQDARRLRLNSVAIHPRPTSPA